jgi:hypothetical protein
MLESQSWASRQIQTNMGKPRYQESAKIRNEGASQKGKARTGGMLSTGGIACRREVPVLARKLGERREDNLTPMGWSAERSGR